jgi:superfamily II DNA or RNA helicase
MMNILALLQCIQPAISGTNVKRLNRIVTAMITMTGRLHRLHYMKKEVLVYDYVDFDVPVLARMFEKRQRGYKSIGYEVEEI